MFEMGNECYRQLAHNWVAVQRYIALRSAGNLSNPRFVFGQHERKKA